MKINTILILGCILCLFGCVKTSPISLPSSKGLYNKNVGYGLSLTPPVNFKVAKTYKGYQAPKKMGSISVETDMPFEELSVYYTKEEIERRDGKVYRHQPATFNEISEAFYVEFYDSPQKRYRLVLVIKKDNVTYHVKGFHRGQPDHELSSTIRKAIWTSHVDTFKEEVEPFSKVYLGEGFASLRYTRDNKFPTEEPDSLVITEIAIEEGEIAKYGQKKYIHNLLKDEILFEEHEVSSEGISNGSLHHYGYSKDGKSRMVMLLLSEKGEGVLSDCTGNQYLDLNKLVLTLKSKYLAITN